MITFLSDEINEPVVKQYHETYPKNTAYDSSNSCDSIIAALKSDLKENPILTIVNTFDLIIFSDEATSTARKEIMGLFITVYEEEKKEVTLEFVSIASIARTRSEMLMDKVQEILLHNNTDISNARFLCLDGTNAMPCECIGL